MRHGLKGRLQPLPRPQSQSHPDCAPGDPQVCPTSSVSMQRVPLPLNGEVDNCEETLLDPLGAAAS